MQDREFAKLLGIPVPDIIQDNCPPEQLILEENTIIKPLTGANSSGCFYVNETGTITSVKSGNSFSSILDGLNDEKSFDSRGRRSNPSNLFRVERQIMHRGLPANDLKAFSFYGNLFLTMEIQRQPVRRLAFYGSDGQWIDPHNIVSSSSDWESFSGTGVPTELNEFQHRIGSRSPVPFLSVDFLRGEDGLFLGEITPHPGLITNTANPKTDQIMGGMFEEAQGRLIHDLLSGKKFDVYLETYKVFL